MFRYVGAFVLGTMLCAPVAVMRADDHDHDKRYYDQERKDYHHWDEQENRAYRHWLEERHEQYRDFARLNREQQRAYWKWRHEHADWEHEHH